MCQVMDYQTADAVSRRQNSTLGRRIAGCQLGLEVDQKWAAEKATYEQLQRLEREQKQGPDWVMGLLHPPIALEAVQPYVYCATWIEDGQIDEQKSEAFWSR